MTKMNEVFSDTNEIIGTILDAAPVGFLLVDKESKIVQFNKHAESMFGFSKSELLHKPIEILLPENIKELHVKLRDDYSAKPSARMMGAGRELFAQRKDASQFPIEIGLGPVKIGKDVYIVVVVIDITEKLAVDANKKYQLEHQHYEELMELSSPLLSVWEGIKVLPLIGTLDSRRTQDAMEKALTCIAEEHIQILIIDITGVLTVDTMVSDHLLRMATAVRLMGGECILTGISPEVARTVIQLGVDLSALHTRSTLAEGLKLGIKMRAGEEGRK